MAGSSPTTVRLRCASWEQLEAIYRRDLARGALFLRASRPPPVGAGMSIRLALPSGTLILLSGAVSEHIGPGGLGGRGPGVDVALDPIPPSTLWLIEAALRAHRRSTFEPSPVAQTSVRPATGGGEPSAPSVEGDAAVAEAEEELIGALRAELDHVRHLGAAQILGLGPNASPREVQEAFAALSKRYHPDKFARYHSRSARDLAAEIFILIRDAYRALGGADSTAPARAPSAGAPRPAAPAASGGRSPGPGPDDITAHLPAGPAAEPASSPPDARRGAASFSPAPTPSAASAAAPEGAEASADAERRDDASSSRGSAPASDDAHAASVFRHPRAKALLDEGRYDEALTLYALASRRDASDREAALGVELAEGLKALEARDRLEAAQRFEAVLELDPDNEVAAKGLTEIRRLATEERKEFLSRLLGDQKE